MTTAFFPFRSIEIPLQHLKRSAVYRTTIEGTNGNLGLLTPSARSRQSEVSSNNLLGLPKTTHIDHIFRVDHDVKAFFDGGYERHMGYRVPLRDFSILQVIRYYARIDAEAFCKDGSQFIFQLMFAKGWRAYEGKLADLEGQSIGGPFAPRFLGDAFGCFHCFKAGIVLRMLLLATFELVHLRLARGAEAVSQQHLPIKKNSNIRPQPAIINLPYARLKHLT